MQEHPGGEYAVSAVINPLGLAKSSLKFNYSFTVASVNPSEGEKTPRVSGNEILQKLSE